MFKVIVLFIIDDLIVSHSLFLYNLRTIALIMWLLPRNKLNSRSKGIEGIAELSSEVLYFSHVPPKTELLPTSSRFVTITAMSSTASVFTASTLLLKTLASAGITHAFVNWGSDHPALLEDLERQRQANVSGEEQDETKPSIVTCPNEMVALSAAQGFAQATGKPAAVIVHVDVGTQVSQSVFQ